MNKNINIVNGEGNIDLINGSYNVEATVTGYDNATINPSTITVNESTNSFEFTISASGNLTLHVSEEGTAASSPIVGATFIRCDSAGNEYGEAIVSDQSGNAVFTNVPYATTDAPLIYYKQTASDGDHEFDNTLKSISLTASEETIEIMNARGANRVLTLTDANYANLPIETGTISLTTN